VKVVLDPNVIISALLSSGTTAAVLDAWLDHRAFDPLVCPSLLAELEEVLSRPKFDVVGRGVTSNVIERLRTEGDLVDDPELQLGVTADPGDDYLIALARQSRADCLVSGDSDLLEARVDDVEILTPAQFLTRLSEA
jgi:uncharacterized protein